MNCDFSETQYSFCFTFEYLKRFFPIIPLPIFPNTVMEGRENGGYDVGINGNLFFQFKIPKHITRKNSKNIQQWNVFNDEFYRIKIDTNSKQYELLKILSQPTNKVYYATPDFHTENSLFDFYQNDQIVSNSAIFDIDAMPIFGSGHHNLIYKVGINTATIFSKPIEIQKTKFIDPREIFFNKQEKQVSIFEQANIIYGLLRSNDFINQKRIELNGNSPSDFVKSIHNVLLTQFNIHWYPVLT